MKYSFTATDFLILLFFNLAAYSEPAVSFVYKNNNKGVSSNTHFSVSANSGGYIVSAICTTDTERTEQEIICDSTFATLQWHYRSNTNTDMYLKRIGDRIEAQGSFRGKPEKKVLKIDNYPWYQIIPFGLQAAAKDSSGRSRLWAVSLQKPAMLKPVCFRVVNSENGPLPGHPEISCRCFRVKIEGLSAHFWSGNYFLRRDDGAFIYYEGHLFGSKKPSETIECVF